MGHVGFLSTVGFTSAAASQIMKTQGVNKSADVSSEPQILYMTPVRLIILTKVKHICFSVSLVDFKLMSFWIWGFPVSRIKFFQLKQRNLALPLLVRLVSRNPTRKCVCATLKVSHELSSLQFYDKSGY